MAPTSNPRITTLDFDANRRTTPHSHGTRPTVGDDDFDFMGQVAEEIIERDRLRMRREVMRVLSFVSAVLMWYVVARCRALRGTMTDTSQPMRRVYHFLLVVWRPVLDRPSLHPISSQCRIYNRRTRHVPSSPSFWLPLRSIFSSAVIFPRLHPVRRRISVGRIHI